jgi:hypothetical protein
MSRCISRAPGGPVDVERYAFREGSRVDQVERDVRAGVGEVPLCMGSGTFGRTPVSAASLKPRIDAKPAVERFILDDPDDFDAGELCGFPVLIEPNVRITLRRLLQKLPGRSASAHDPRPAPVPPRP